MLCRDHHLKILETLFEFSPEILVSRILLSLNLFEEPLGIPFSSPTLTGTNIVFYTNLHEHCHTALWIRFVLQFYDTELQDLESNITTYKMCHDTLVLRSTWYGRNALLIDRSRQMQQNHEFKCLHCTMRQWILWFCVPNSTFLDYKITKSMETTTITWKKWCDNFCVN